jgi:ankyrin repeat protein
MSAAGAGLGQRAPATGQGNAPRQQRRRECAGNAAAAVPGDANDDAFVDAGAVGFVRTRQQPNDGGQLTPLIYAARANDLETVKVLLAAGVDVNQTSGYGWSALLVATQNRYYKLGAYLLEHGADPNLTNKGAWTPLYIATDNRNIENGDYPVRKPDMDHLDFIKLLLDKGANVNARVKDSTETRTVFTNQWLDENGGTAFFRASQSGDVELMKLLLAHGADPKIPTVLGVTALHVAAGIGWVEGITYEWSPKANFEAVKMLIDLGNRRERAGRYRSHRAPRCCAQGSRRRDSDPGGSRRQARHPRLRQHRQPRRQTGHTHVAAGRLCGWSRSRGRAVCHSASGGGGAAAQADDRAGPARSADGSHAGVDLHHRGLRLGELAHPRQLPTRLR